MKKNSNIDSWIRKAFQEAGEQAEAMEKIIARIQVVLEKKNEDILNAWAEITDKAVLMEVIEKASDNDDFAGVLDDLLRMGVIAGYLAALDDIRFHRFTIEDGEAGIN